jgi:hypothetical protein
MHLTARILLGRRGERRAPAERRGGHVPTAAPAPASPAPAGRPGPRRLDAPQDQALFTCTCGFAWTGAVTTSVGCPHCGTAQAW